MTTPTIDDVQRLMAHAKAAGMKPVTIDGTDYFCLFGGGKEPVTEGSLEVHDPRYGKGRAYPVEATA